MNSITVEMVEKFQILEKYQQRLPCTHTCKIVLKDGRKGKVAIEGPEIYILIQAMAKEKIVFKRTKDTCMLAWKPQTIDHFNDYAECPYSTFRNTSIAPLPNELLLSLFKNQSS
ncbi:hypothetical protein [Criblamydia sequanensis]|uniref:Uncharacterized protein n=1 Tax=Candidatus Criblamydia sequanensis CRIB-18 TaxID=1437425 RepID=A0A090DXW8_9BACT|nr:hypothetical protein [Criblamydia sequanensis]CDR33619.1 hypothetical protein CSEC_0790 [Criblamydia sequanensis CRIB-18]